MHSRQGFGVRGGVIKIRNKRTVALRLTPHALTLTVLVLAVVGCSGSKVTTKSSAELPRYQIRTIALVPFTTLATPQVRDVVDQTLSAPPGARRSDMAIAVSAEYRTASSANSHSADRRWGHRHAVTVEPVDGKAGYDSAFAG